MKCVSSWMIVSKENLSRGVQSKRNVTLLYICVTFQADFEETVQVECYISRDIDIIRRRKMQIRPL